MGRCSELRGRGRRTRDEESDGLRGYRPERTSGEKRKSRKRGIVNGRERKEIVEGKKGEKRDC